MLRCVLDLQTAVPSLLPGPGTRCEAGGGTEHARRRRHGSRVQRRRRDAAKPLTPMPDRPLSLPWAIGRRAYGPFACRVGPSTAH
uniref:Uncharacterized protein n=1 Tax=Oryza rufipogon TaxID=4529 RepID=A0A0E0PL48_ORYRU